MEVSIGRRDGRGWMDDVKVALGSSGVTVEIGPKFGKDRREWRALVHMLLIA